MTLLVLGASGQLARALAGPGCVCLGRAALDLAAPGLPDRFEAALNAHAPTAVINAAAWTDVDGAEKAEAAEELHAVNCSGPAVAAALCAERDLPFVQVSTEFVFDGQGEAPWRPADPVAPLSAYGRAKADGEAAVRAARGRQAILRTSWVFGAGARNFVTAMLRLGATRDRLQVVSDEIGGPTFAPDLAQACRTVAEALSRDPDLGGTYHYAGGPDLSRADFAREILRRAGSMTRVDDIAAADWTAAAARPLNSRLDCSDTEAAFGLPRPDWGPGLDRVIADWKERQDA